jgi:hypothetical protein
MNAPQNIFFRKGMVVWQDQVHLYPQVEGEVLELPAKEDLAIVHKSYQSWQAFISKQRKYAKSEARNRKKTGEDFSIFRLVWLPLREFLARYIKHEGYLDGINGLFLVIILMWYHILVEWYLLIGISDEKKA